MVYCYKACKKGCFSAAKLLLANGADFEKTEFDGLNVFGGIKSGNLEMVKLMLLLRTRIMWIMREMDRSITFTELIQPTPP